MRPTRRWFTRRVVTVPAGELARFLRIETVGGSILLVATAVALIWANSPFSATYRSLAHTQIGPAALHLNLTVAAWTSDALLAVFFLVAGLELKRELTVGELSDPRRAALPVVAALGGMIVPALFAVLVGCLGAGCAPGVERTWTIPVATDIAFALGVLALAGTALPATARAFLLGLAVVDDLGAIALIAGLFTDAITWVAVGVTVLLALLYWWLQRRRVRSPWLYVPLAIALWCAVHASGIHATVAGVLLGLLTRAVPDDGEDEAPVVRMEHRLQPWSAGICVPLFALFSAGVPLAANDLRGVLTDRIALGVAVGLLAGKLLGIFTASVIAVKLTPAVRPAGLGWWDMLAVSMLGGVGFTVSLLLTELSIHDGAQVDRAKAAVLLSSAVAGLLAAMLLVFRGRVHRAATPG
ncbi:MAG TPA: Na+/H+ antiporter NhaA [Pseudonocardia sp.]|jgi:NhaA family Na+:H+ antiporter|nr:Na+/H+ antiporter NhaA [Pseudonocardia sp.]